MGPNFKMKKKCGSTSWKTTAALPTRSSLEAFARGVLVPGSILCDNLHKNKSSHQLDFASKCDLSIHTFRKKPWTIATASEREDIFMQPGKNGALLVVVVLHKLLQLLNIPDGVEILLNVRQHWYIY